MTLPDEYADIFSLDGWFVNVGAAPDTSIWLWQGWLVHRYSPLHERIVIGMKLCTTNTSLAFTDEVSSFSNYFLEFLRIHPFLSYPCLYIYIIYKLWNWLVNFNLAHSLVWMIEWATSQAGTKCCCNSSVDGTVLVEPDACFRTCGDGQPFKCGGGNFHLSIYRTGKGVMWWSAS